MEFQKLSTQEVQYLTSLFASPDQETVSKMADVDENEVFDSCFAFLDTSRQPASKSATDCTETGCPENDCLDSVFPFVVREQVQKSVKHVADGIADLRQREQRLARMEQTIDHLRAVVQKMASQTPADTVRDESYEWDSSPTDSGSVFDPLFPGKLPAMAG